MANKYAVIREYKVITLDYVIADNEEDADKQVPHLLKEIRCNHDKIGVFESRYDVQLRKENVCKR